MENARIWEVNGVILRVIDAGPVDGPLVILLHGFPDFWWGWHAQIEVLACAGFRVVVPDLRGYAGSSKPGGVAAYELDTLAADVAALADCYGRETFHLAGHDWGGIIAWQVAHLYPQRTSHLAILNAPQPDTFMRYVRRHPGQMLRSSYAAWFQWPWLPEVVLKSRDFAFLRRALRRSSRPGTFSAADLERYVEAWSEPGALSAMIDYYRALARRPWRALPRIEPKTLVIWGTRDVFLEIGVAKASLKRCKRGQSLFLGAGHWVHLEESEAVNAALIEFFGVAAKA